MDTILEKILKGEITSDDLTDPLQIVKNEDEKEKLKQHSIGELVPFLLNYLREKTLHHLTPRQSAALTPKKTSVSHGKGVPEKALHVAKGSSRGNVFPSQKTPSPSPVTPLSQSRRDTPSSSPNFKRKSPKVPGNERISPLVTQPKLNIDDPNDFPPMKSTSKKVTPSRRITPTQVKGDGRKGKSSPAFASSPFSSSHSMLDGHGSPASLQEERDLLKIMKSKRKNKGDSPWGYRTSPSPQTGIRSPPSHVLGDFIITPPKHPTAVPDAWQKNKSKPDESLISTPSPYKSPDASEASDILTADPRSCEQSEKQSCIEEIQPVQAVKDKVIFHIKLDALAKIYSRCITENLVPNVTAEIYFVVQLLTARGIAHESRQEEINGNNLDDQNILDSIHNSTYFAVTVLEEIKRLVLLLDKETLRLLADNPRIADFSPGLKETFLQQYKTYSVKKVTEMNFVKSPLGGVPFSVERDNKQNFPTDRAFHNFRKQRDVFYELVREWEDSHLAAGWTMEEHMGDRIRALVNQKPELANYSHFARLFKSQLLQMCEEERSGSDFRSSNMLSSLQKSNPEKFQRLQERFITPLSSGGPCPAPSFSHVQEFFKGFIQSAASHSFNQHLMDLLIVKITEINNKEFPLSDIKEGSDKDLSIQNQEVQQDFSSCLLKIRILAKFLGFLIFQPYHGTETSSQTIVTETLKLRNRIPIHFDILSYLKMAWCSGRLVLTVPWAVEYLSMMDPVAPLLDYFSVVLNFLYRIYRESASLFSKKILNHSKLLLISCLGWFFEISIIPATFFFKSLNDVKNCIEDDLKRNYSDVKPSLDSRGIVDQAILYTCCPFLSVIRTVLVEAAAGMSGRSGPVKKITPVSAGEPSSRSSSHKQLQLQLEENFFRIQPDFLKRLSDFTVERLCSNIISHIKGGITPSLLNEGGKRIQAFLDSEFSANTNTDQAKEKCRPHVLKIIHSVTDDGVKTALETLESCKEKSLKAFQNLCPQEMNSKVVTTAANITTRLVKEKTMDWINTSFPNLMEEELFAQFNKIANSIMHLKTKEQNGNGELDPHSKDITKISEVRSERHAKCCEPVGVSGENINPAMKIKALQAVLSEQSKLLAMHSSNEIPSEAVDAVRVIQDALMDEGQVVLIGQITVELVFILV
ncbi:codanin-1-like [Pocillopora verrucosa]|uniref:codanin-1-like n=1 Tax=Pocillopora verrucosa TaxID=203993 RepID=UPI00333FAF65